MKRIYKLLSVLMLLAALLSLCACSDSNSDKIYIYNWGEYISDGSFETFDSIAGFKEYYKDVTGRDIEVYYTTYPSNEDMYAKISGETSAYDVIFPSDYMIERMISENLLEPIKIEEVCSKYNTECYYKYITDDFRNLYYDPTDEYSVPYTYGRVGIIYNPNLVDEEDCTGWEIMWNEKYKGQILQFNNARDAFATAQFLLGYNVNSEDPNEWKAALDKLLEQKELVQSYVMDEIYNKLESGEAAIGSYYAGDFFTMKLTNDELKFFYPDETNLFVDAMCIPKGSQNPEAAALFINYMLTEEPAVANAEFIFYASPDSLVLESEEYLDFMGEECIEVLYPEDFNFHDELEKNAYKNLSQESLEMISDLWEELKISGGLPSSVYIISIILGIIIAAIIIFLAARKKYRSKYY